MRWLWRLMYSEYHLVEGDEVLASRVRAVLVQPGVGTLKLMTQMLVFCGIPVVVVMLFLFFRISQNPSVSPVVLPAAATLASIGLCTAFLFCTRNARNRVFRRALIECGVPVCSGCGYDLVDSDDSEACPECGSAYPELGDPATALRLDPKDST